MLEVIHQVGNTLWRMDVNDGHARISCGKHDGAETLDLRIAYDTSNETDNHVELISVPLTKGEAWELMMNIAETYGFELKVDGKG